MDYLHRLSVRKKIQYLAALGCAVSLVFFCLFTLPTLWQSVNETLDNSYQIALNTVCERLEDGFRELHQIAATLTCTGGPVTQAHQYLLSNDILEQKQIKTNLVNHLILEDFSSSVVGTISYYLPGNPDQAFISNSNVIAFQAATSASFYTQIPFSVYNTPRGSVIDDGNIVLSLTRYAGTVRDQDYYLYLESDPEFLRELSTQLIDRAGKQMPICLIDSVGNVLYSAGEAPVHVGDLLELDEISSQYVLFTYETEHWDAILCVPRGDYYRLYFSTIKGYLLTLLCFLVIYVILTNLSYRTAYTPLNNFVKELSDFGLSGIYRSSTAHSQEFDEYYQKIQQMRDQIRNLVSEVENESKQNAYLENQLLRSRINPHFLHNTLAGICEQARTSGQEELGNTIQALNSLLYHNLGKNKITTLRDEISAVEDYVLLQRRVQDFIYKKDIQVQDDILSMELPSFVLQPLVENSIIHSKSENLEIELHVRVQNGLLLVELEDNGQGIAPDQQEEINNRLHQCSAQGMGIGLAYVNSSLKYFFAHRASLTVQNALGHSGTLVTITIIL